MAATKDLGDFQTPPGLVAAVLERLGPVGARWPRVLEPTCGRGHFLAGLLALAEPPREVHGVELQASHLRAARSVARAAGAGVKVGLTRADFFALDLKRVPSWTEAGPLLVVGNPPWITTGALGSLGSRNGPARRKARGLAGLAARTGASNFDLAEAVWLKLLDELGTGPGPATVALLCKLSVARRVLEHVGAAGLAVSDPTLRRIDARAWFGAAVEACLLCLTVGPAPEGAARGLGRVPLYPDLEAQAPTATLGLVRGRLVADLDAYAPLAFADGVCPLDWRQGLKHDAAGAVELTSEGRVLRNRQGEAVDVEPEHVYPWLKGTDLARSVDVDDTVARPARAVLVTQHAMTDDTRTLERSAPRLWSYLERHADRFARRRSSIYRGRPPYAMFGVGPYSFAAWKVAVSGLHASARFRALGPVEGRPALVDDTCYLAPCASPEQAALVAAVANLPEARALLRAMNLPGTKRPVTKALLQRLDLRALFDRSDRAAVVSRAAATFVRLAGRPPTWPGDPGTLLVPE